MLRSLAALVLVAPFVACGPPQAPMQHPGLSTFGTACSADHKCPHDLDCVRAGGYGGDTGNCEKRCNYDADCGLDARCKMVEGAPAPMCRAKS
jgi:hypothetical protein